VGFEPSNILRISLGYIIGPIGMAFLGLPIEVDTGEEISTLPSSSYSLIFIVLAVF